MNGVMKPVHQRLLGVLALLALVALTTPTARAQVFDQDVATEVVLEDQAVNTLALISLFGPTSTPVPLTYTLTSVGTGGFEYSLTSPLSYNGNNLTGLTSSAIFSGSGQDWTADTTAFGYLDGSTTATWQMIGKQTIKWDPIQLVWDIISDYDIRDANGNKTGDAHIEVFYEPVTRTSTDRFWFTDADGIKIPESDYRSRDRFNPSTGRWEIEIYPDYPRTYPNYLVSTLESDPNNGGAGSVTTLIAPVPEPSSMSLGVLALTFVAGFARLRRRLRPAA
ncbi:MAG: hypothetical protein U0790_23655 [Isosphaeraceae bacterium]